MRMNMCVHVCVYRCMCICMYTYTYMSVYMYSYTFIYTRVWVYTCTRVGAFCLFVLSNLMVSACYWRGRLCFGRGRDRGFILYISLFLRVLGWGVCVCLYTRVHTHKLLGHLM